MTRRRPFTLAALGAAAVLALSACASSSPGGAEAGGSGTGGVRVVASTTQVADFTREIVGDAGTVTQLVQPNRSAHSFDPSAADLNALRQADVLVINGLSLETWMGDAVAASGFDGATVVATRDIRDADLRSALAGHDHDAEHSGDDHGAEAPDDHDHDHSDDAAPQHDGTSTTAPTAGDDHVHEPSGVDPHVWTDPVLAHEMVRTIVEGLSDARPDHADTFRANGDAYLDTIDALIAWMTENIERVPAAERQLVSNHDAFGYFVERFGLDYIGSVMPSFDDNAEPSAADIDALVAAIRSSGVQAVFSETSISPKTAETIAKEAGVRVYSGDEALYGDSLGAAGTDGSTYIGSQIHNVRALLDSWGATATPLPAALE